MTPRIELPPLFAPVDKLWHVLLDLGERLTVPWSVIGGQMVLLHVLEHGLEPPQISQDGDVIADIRADPAALMAISAELEDMGFAPEISTDGIAHRYTRVSEPSPLVIDVLAPEGVGDRANLVTSPPGRTIEVPGGTQALKRTELVTIRHETRDGSLPRPTLLAAIVGKAAATQLPRPERHYRDLALLLCLVDDPFGMVDELTTKDRRRLRSAKLLDDEAHPAWALVPSEIRSRGQIAYGILSPEM
ncbi:MULTISPECIES: hypothetical protein [unclassified Aeromicrobium]|uniref:hypothetical protein n=1 Tax=unclassified Aeromicrobium TaxID=2633570 RepID=UPI00396B2A95